MRWTMSMASRILVHKVVPNMTAPVLRCAPKSLPWLATGIVELVVGQVKTLNLCLVTRLVEKVDDFSGAILAPIDSMKRWPCWYASLKTSSCCGPLAMIKMSSAKIRARAPSCLD